LEVVVDRRASSAAAEEVVAGEASAGEAEVGEDGIYRQLGSFGSRGGVLERDDVVEGEQTAAVGGDDEVVGGLDELHVKDRGEREAALERLPTGAIVTGVKQAGVGAGDEEAFLVRILAYHAGRGG